MRGSDDDSTAGRILSMLGLGAILAGIVLAHLTCSGCSPSALATQARAAQVTAIATSAVGEQIDAARARALDAVEAEHPARGEERDAALDAEAARWRPAGQALDGVREVLVTWIAAIEAARIVGEQGASALWPQILSLAAQAVALYGRIADLARTLGVDAPALDLGGLIGGAR